MKLPDTNAITLPESNEDWLALDGSNADDGPLPEWDVAALRERFLPAYLRKGTDPLRDAFLKAWARQANRQRADGIRLMAAQKSPRFAWGALLLAWGEEKHIPQAPNESDAAYRARLLEDPVGIAPKAVQDTIRALFVTRFAPKRLPVFVETKRDFAFWRSASAASDAPRSYWQSRAAGHGRIWASGRRTGLRTAGAYWVSAGTRTVIPSNPTGTTGPNSVWAILPATLSAKRGGWGRGATLTARGAFWGHPLDAGPPVVPRTCHTVWISNATNDLLELAVRLLSGRLLAGVTWWVMVDPHLTYSITR